MPSANVTGITDYAGGQSPVDLMYIGKSPFGVTDDRVSTLNDLFETITKNITEKAVIFQDADGVRTVSAVNTGKLSYSVTNQSFQVSENGGAYQHLVKGVGANTRVAFWTDTDTLSRDSAFLWDENNDRLLINVSVANGEAPIDVQADALASAQQWRENAGAAKVLMQVPSSFGQLGTVGAHDFALVTNSLQRVNVESGGAAVFGSIVPATGQVMINALTVNTVGLVVNNFAATNVDLARFQINSSNRFVFTKDAEMVAGLAATIDGKITLASAGAAFTQSLMAGTAPAATNAFRWPNADPTAGQALTASAPAAGVVTLSWTSITTAPAAPTGSVQFNGGGVFDGDSNLLWDDTPKQLLVGGIALAAGEAPIDVKADVTASAQQWRENAGAAKVLMQVPSSFGQLGTVGAHDFALVTNSLQRLNIESGGAAVFGSIVPATAQVMINALTVNTVGLVVNNFAATNVDLARLQINSSNRFIFTKDAEMVTGLASTVDGKITLASAGAAFTQSLMAGTAPAATNAFRWPNADPTSGQALTASAPVAGVVTLSWTSITTAPAAPTGSVQFNGGGVFDGDSNLLWDDTAKQLLVGGIALAAGEAPIDVKADVTASAQQWRENAGAAKVLMQVPSSYGQLGTVGAHDFALVTNSLQRLNIESGGAAVFGSIVPATAQVMINALTVNTVGLVVNNFAATNVDLARLQINSSNRFVFTKDAEMVAGLASTVDGKITLASAGAAFTQSLMAGTAPAATNAFRWPNADPTSGQALTASAPAAGVVTLSWTTVGGTTINPTNGVMPVRTSATTFGDSKISLATNSTVVTANDAAAFVVGPNGATNPTLVVVTNVASAQTGLSITGNAAGSGVTLTALTSGTNENIDVITAGTGGLRVKPGTNTALTFQVLNTSNQAIARLGDGGAGAGGEFVISQATTTKVAISGNVGVTVASDRGMFWESGTSIAGARDTSIVRLSANSLRIANASTGAGSLLIGTSTDSVTGNFTVMSSNAATNSLITVARLGVNSTGTAADGFGASLSFSAESSTTNDSETARVNAFWTTATHANRTAALSWSLTNNTTLAEYMRLGVAALSSPVVLSVHGGTNPNVWTSGSFAPKLYLIGATLPAVGVAAHFSATALDAPQWQMLRGRGSNASPTAVQSSDSIGNIEWWGQTSTSTNNVVAGARIRVSATENWSAGNNGCQMIFFTSNNAGTITDRMYLKETGTLRIGATSGSYDTTNLLQVGNYSSFATGVLASLYTGANGTKGLQVIGTNGATGNLIEAFRDGLTPNLLTLAASGLFSLRAGLNTGTLVANVGGVLKVNTTSAGNTGTGETDLMTYSIAANTVGTNGDFLRFECAGTFEVSGNNKRLRAYLGSTVLFDTTALAFAPSTAVDWRLVVTIFRTGSSAQGAICQFAASGSVLTSTVQSAGGTEDFTTALTFKLTGQGGASNEIFQDLMIAEWNPNN